MVDIAEVDRARRQFFDEALRLNSLSASAYDALGRVLCIKLDFKMAINCFDMAIALDGSKSQYRKNREIAARTEKLSMKISQERSPNRGIA